MLCHELEHLTATCSTLVTIIVNSDNADLREWEVFLICCQTKECFIPDSQDLVPFCNPVSPTFHKILVPMLAFSCRWLMGFLWEWEENTLDLVRFQAKHLPNTAVPMSTKLLGGGAERQGTFRACISLWSFLTPQRAHSLPAERAIWNLSCLIIYLLAQFFDREETAFNT